MVGHGGYCQAAEDAHGVAVQDCGAEVSVAGGAVAAFGGGASLAVGYCRPG